MTRIPEILKKISLPRILLLILYHHPQMEPNPPRHSQLKKTRIVVFAGENSIIKAKAKVRIVLPLTSMPLPSEKIKTKTKKNLANIEYYNYK